MLSSLILTTCLAQAGAEAPAALELPKPHYHAHPGDPAWLGPAVQFHGHLGPWVVAGTRLGMAGLRAVGAKGFFDVDVTCEGPFEKPPRSCFLDGLQLGTGATWGKRKLTWKRAEEVLVRVKNTATGRTAELRLTPELMGLLASLKTPLKAADNHDREPAAPSAVEKLARKVALIGDRELFTVEITAAP